MKDLYAEGLLAGCSAPMDVDGFIDVVWSLAPAAGPFRVAFETRSSDPKWPHGSDYHWFQSREEVAKAVNDLYSRFDAGGDVGLKQEDARAKCHLLYLPSLSKDGIGVSLPELNRLGGEHSWIEWERFGQTGTSAIWIGGLYIPSPRPETLDRTVSPYLSSLAELVRNLVPPTRAQLAWCGEMGNTREVAVRTAKGRLWFLNWVNIFGPRYVERYGRDYLHGAPGYQIEETPDGYIRYQITKGFVAREAEDPSPSKVEAYFSSHPLVKKITYRPWLKKILGTAT